MYQAFYRKYRPKCFADVYGQDHVVSTLKNELSENKISHAYLFTGSRGTGKTTCAKILAKAVNCENMQDGEPCNRCEICKGMDNSTIYDIVEIDAASNNGVDNIRDLREEANYTPSRGKYRVYIIDEVHMLSIGAFNALLKILEEPPAHVIFILATTEVHKIPATILSRCQRFDFKRIQPETMAVRLKQVAGLENLTITDDAAVLIARIADGALRDGLSILDQCSSRSSNIDSDLVSQVAGLAGREALYSLADCISSQNSSKAVELIAQLYENSYDMERLCVEMINHFRNYLVVKTVKNNRELIVCTDNEYESLVESAKNFTLEKIIFSLDLFQTTLTKIKGGANSRIEMEMTFIKLCQPKLEQSMEAVLERIGALERAVKNGVKLQTPVQTEVKQQEKVTAAVDIKTETKQEEAVVIPDTNTQPQQKNEAPQAAQPEVSQEKPVTPAASTNETAVEQQANVSSGIEPFEQWEDFLDIIHKTDIGLYGVLRSAEAHLQNGYFVIDSTNPTVKEFIKIPTHLKAIKQAVFDLTGQSYKVGVTKQKKENSQKRDLLEDLINQAQNNVTIKFE